jgi:hypothetical protein
MSAFAFAKKPAPAAAPSTARKMPASKDAARPPPVNPLSMQLAMSTGAGSPGIVQQSSSRSEPGDATGQTGAPADRVRATALAGMQGDAQRLPHLDAIQRAFGRHDVRGVRAHMDGPASAAAEAIGAVAYTVGDAVAFRGAPHLHTAAHEAAHVVQQRAGVEVPHGLGRAGDRYERHADAVADRVVRGQAAEGLLGEVAGSARGGRQAGGPAFVQRQIVSHTSTTAPTSNPKALIPLAKFIQYVEAVEKAYPSDSPTDIITRIRVQYYSGAAFESLIPDAHYEDTYWALHPDITWSVSRTMEKSKIDKVDPDAYEHLTAHADENKIGDNPSPYVVMPSGDKVDVGHLLLGLDALIHPRTGDPYAALGVPNIDPSSWVADIGIAAVWMTQHEQAGSPPSDAPKKLASPDLNAYYQMSAPKEDLLGDVDSFGLHVQFASTAKQTLSQALRAYYIGSATSSAGVKQRWQTFCSKNALGFTRSGSSITWDAGVRAALIKRVDTFNDLYGAGKFGSIWNMLKQKVGATVPHRSWPHTPAVVDKFLDWVKTNVEAELSAGGTKP